MFLEKAFQRFSRSLYYLQNCFTGQLTSRTRCAMTIQVRNVFFIVADFTFPAATFVGILHNPFFSFVAMSTADGIYSICIPPCSLVFHLQSK